MPFSLDVITTNALLFTSLLLHLLRSPCSDALLLPEHVGENISPEQLKGKIIVKGKLGHVAPGAHKHSKREGSPDGGTSTREETSSPGPEASGKEDNDDDDDDNDKHNEQEKQQVRLARLAQIKHDKTESRGTRRGSLLRQGLGGALGLHEMVVFASDSNAADRPAKEPSAEAKPLSFRRIRNSIMGTFGAAASATPKKKRSIDPGLASIISMPAKAFDKFWAPMIAAFDVLGITSLSERKILTLLDDFSGKESGIAALQRRTAVRLCRVYPRATRVASSNADPLPLWRTGAQLVCLNMQTNDLPTQLHYALFELGGGSGYVLKPRELREVPEPKKLRETLLMQKLRVGRAFRLTMGGLVEPTTQEQHSAAAAVQATWRGRQTRAKLRRKASGKASREPSRGKRTPAQGVSGGKRTSAQEAGIAGAGTMDARPFQPGSRRDSGEDQAPPQVSPSFWPTTRTSVTRVSVRILGLYHLPTRREGRPKLIGGPRAAALAFIPELNGERAMPDSGAVPSSPSVRLSVHAIGGFACVSRYNPPPDDAGTTAATPPVYFNGLNPSFNHIFHCLAAEPRETILRVAVAEDDVEVAYETTVLGILRPGYRCFQMRSLHGTRVRLCAVFVHIRIGQEANVVGESSELRRVVGLQETIIADKERQLEKQLKTIHRLEERLEGSNKGTARASTASHAQYVPVPLHDDEQAEDAKAEKSTVRNTLARSIASLIARKSQTLHV